MPDAWSACAPGQWPGALLAGLELKRAALSRLGFDFFGADVDDWSFVRTATDELFDERVERLKNDIGD